MFFSWIATLIKPSQRHSDVDAELRRYLEIFFPIFLVMGALSVAGSLIRVLQFGWLYQQFIHIIIYLLMVAAFLLRKKMAVPVAVMVLLSLLGVDALANLATFGLASNGTLMLGYIIIMTGTFVSLRAGILTTVISIATLSLFGLLISTGIIPMHFDGTRYISSWTVWVTQITTFIILMLTAVIATSGIKARLLDSLHTLEKRTEDLSRANQFLTLSEKKIRTIVNTAPEAITTADLNGRITSCNQATLELVGCSNEQELIGRPCADFIIPEDRERTVATIISTLEKNIIRDIEYHLLPVTGKPVPVKMAVSILRDDNEHPLGFLTIAQDISRAKTMEEQLRQSEKLEAIGRLAGGIAHDFNNQLTGIVGFADILRADLAHLPQQLSDIEAILTAAKRASGLTAQLLSFARKGQLQSIPFDVHEIIAEVVGILKRTLDKNITISQHLASEKMISTGDPNQLQNAILNIALNARDAMPAGGTLTITTRAGPLPSEQLPGPPQPGIGIIITDTGIGMDEATKRKIFEPFFTTKQQGKGTGMGLASVYGAVKSHGGSITIESELEKGTTVTMFLKRHLGPPVERTEPSRHPEVTAKTSKGAYIIIVDDEELIRSYSVKLLEKSGYRTASFRDGMEALAYFVDHYQSVDLVVLDMVMPKLDGKATYAALSKIDPGVRVLFCSGYDPDGAVQRLLANNNTGFISKPFVPKNFLDKIGQMLGSSTLINCRAGNPNLNVGGQQTSGVQLP